MARADPSHRPKNRSRPSVAILRSPNRRKTRAPARRRPRDRRASACLPNSPRRAPWRQRSSFLKTQASRQPLRTRRRRSPRGKRLPLRSRRPPILSRGQRPLRLPSARRSPSRRLPTPMEPIRTRRKRGKRPQRRLQHLRPCSHRFAGLRPSIANRRRSKRTKRRRRKMRRLPNVPHPRAISSAASAFSTMTRCSPAGTQRQLRRPKRPDPKAIQSLASLEKNHAAALFERMREAAEHNDGGMEKVLSEMAPGGAFEDLRKEFDRAMSEEPGFQKAYDRAANDLSSYATQRGVVAEISQGASHNQSRRSRKNRPRDCRGRREPAGEGSREKRFGRGGGKSQGSLQGSRRLHP
ncbi:protein of unknown function (plasmid) [Methylocella tundrae]|uniref:Uncharacterized protein n=1 Tax=Methylocella tundrae TaxID=227605 RepID=A0A4U8Z7X0_METTU|nr:protein of unknown function [Methylocella tundrae]